MTLSLCSLLSAVVVMLGWLHPPYLVNASSGARQTRSEPPALVAQHAAPTPTLTPGEVVQHAAHPATADWGTAWQGLAGVAFLVLSMLLLLWAARGQFGGRTP